MSLDIKQQKRRIRIHYRAIRKNIDQDYCIYAANSLINMFNQNFSCIKGKTIAAYTPMDEEINVIPLMYNFLNLGYQIVIPKKNQALEFEGWKKPSNAIIIPDIIITPMIAFDGNFNRVGFGKGWYDRVMEKLLPIGKIFVGVAYEAQYYKDLPIEDHDQKLNLIITETRIRVR